MRRSDPKHAAGVSRDFAGNCEEVCRGDAARPHGCVSGFRSNPSNFRFASRWASLSALMASTARASRLTGNITTL